MLPISFAHHGCFRVPCALIVSAMSVHITHFVWAVAPGACIISRLYIRPLEERSEWRDLSKESTRDCN